jgi:hypothetical protein
VIYACAFLLGDCDGLHETAKNGYNSTDRLDKSHYFKYGDIKCEYFAFFQNEVNRGRQYTDNVRFRIVKVVGLNPEKGEPLEIRSIIRTIRTGP